MQRMSIGGTVMRKSAENHCYVLAKQIACRRVAFKRHCLFNGSVRQVEKEPGCLVSQDAATAIERSSAIAGDSGMGQERGEKVSVAPIVVSRPSVPQHGAREIGFSLPEAVHCAGYFFAIEQQRLSGDGGKRLQVISGEHSVGGELSCAAKLLIFDRIAQAKAPVGPFLALAGLTDKKCVFVGGPKRAPRCRAPSLLRSQCHSY